MSDQRNNEATYWTKNAVIGLMKVSTHTTKKLKKDIKSFEIDRHTVNSRNKVKSSFTMSEKMIKDYQKKIFTENMTGDINDFLKSFKLVEDAVKLKVEETRKTK